VNAFSGNGLPMVTAGDATTGYDIFGISGTAGPCSNSGAYRLYLDHSGSACLVSTQALTPKTWNHVAISFDMATDSAHPTVTFYINGTAAGSQSGRFHDYDLKSFILGGNLLGGNTTQASFNGMIDELRLYQGALSAGMAQVLANNTIYTLHGQI